MYKLVVVEPKLTARVATSWEQSLVFRRSGETEVGKPALPAKAAGLSTGGGAAPVDARSGSRHVSDPMDVLPAPPQPPVAQLHDGLGNFVVTGDIPNSRSNAPDDDEQGSTLRTGSLWAVIVLGVVSVSGIAFWIAAELRFPSEAVGHAAAWYTLIQLVVTGIALGGPILVNRTGGDSDSARTAGAAMAALLAVGVPIGLLAPLAAKAEWRSVAGLDGPLLGLLVAFLVVGSALSLLVDARLMSMRKWRTFFVRATVPAVLRVLMLLVDPWSDQAAWILVAAVAPVAVSGAIAALLLMTSGGVEAVGPQGIRSDLRRFFLVQHVGAVAAQLPYHVVPYLVARRVAPEINGAFYLIWSVGVVSAAVPTMLSQVLLSETSLARAGRIRMIRATLAVNVFLMFAGWLGSLILGGAIFRRLGPHHEEIAAVLPFVLLASLAWSITAVVLTEARLRNDSTATGLITATIVVGTIGFALLFMSGDPVWGAVVAWLGANLAATLVGMVAMELRTAEGSET